MGKERPTFLTGASGYLGSHIMALAPRVVPVKQNDYASVADQVVIHAGAVVPRNLEEANDRNAQRISLGSALRLFDKKPRFVVFVSTRAKDTEYAHYKWVAEIELRDSGIEHHIVRLPGLFGPPRKSGLVYNLVRGLMLDGTFTTDTNIRNWRGMWVQDAALLCLRLTDPPRPGMTVVRNKWLDELIQWATEASS